MSNDPKLDELVRTWKAPSPSGAFEADVLRRIRQRVPEPRRSWLESLLLRPAAPLALATVLGALVAVVATPERSTFGGGLFRTGTITGGYAQLVQGATR